MISRVYIYGFFAIGSLLFAFEGLTIWSIIFMILGLFPLFRIKGSPAYLHIFLSALVCFLFFAYGTITLENNVTTLSGDESVLQGKILTEPIRTSSKQVQFQVKTREGEKVQVFGGEKLTSVNPGETCSFEGVLNSPRRATNPFEFDYLDYLLKQRIHWIFQVNDERVACLQPSTLIDSSYLRKFRKSAIDFVTDARDSDAIGMVTALVFGDRSYIHVERLDQYQKLGIIHLLAVSGLHVGLLTFTIYQLLIRFGVTREYANIVLLIILPFYIVIAGGAPSVVRASLMCMAVLIANLLKWRLKALDSISVVCIILLLYDPFYLYHLGFQLSFLTSFALIVSSRLFIHCSGLLLMVRVTIVAQLISIPIILFHFYEVSLFTLPMNVLFIPFVSMWILPLSFIFVFTILLFPPIASLVYFLMSSTLTVMHSLVDVVMSLQWGMLVFGKPSMLMMLFMYISILLFFLQLETKQVKRITLSLLLIGFVFSAQNFLPYFKSEATITMLDVGQGDSIVIELPNRKGVYLVDTGGVISWGERGSFSSGPGSRIVEPFLKGKGIHKVDKVIITHGHIDHMGELCYLTNVMNIDQVLYPKSTSLPHQSIAPLTCAREKGIPIRWIEEGDRWQRGDSLFYVLHPTGEEVSENNRSIVFLAKINGVSVLFTGDLEKEGEQRIVNDYLSFHVDILKVGHHGSATSTTESFLQQIMPKTALIPVGRNNIYGHPNKEVINRLGEYNVEVLRTDLHGAIEVGVYRGEYETWPFINE
ncbi:DNA internalization-related competence protein ComEC/Rec2 [Bacillus shivajii]|uniref:DNA internalization-related competence protein ComEC/Rec2 n=1 Tax=Bacillus shivajii TaxID=1983719 RepID=UPI001CFC18F2|nr:DNA internalization-related competence protein ComEC/Rec2 [Bacillus shivajii]UCZ54475.1 DNA internalization-related competence protein ComEC/Rec2 [Bacillus shivajii]